MPSLSFNHWRSAMNHLTLIALLGLGLGLRLVNLKNPPLDFHPTRQLHSAIISRGMFFQMSARADPALRAKAIELWNSQPVYEPPILERLVALTYLAAGGEHLWIARLYSSCFWILGGLGLYLLVKRISGHGPALLSLAYYLFLEFAVYASRSFQPEPLLTMGLIWSAYAIYRWSESLAWKHALLAGLCTGITILVKISALFPLAGIVLAVQLGELSQLKSRLRNPQLWLLALLSGGFPAAYYLLQIGPRAGDFLSFWSISFVHLLVEPVFYWIWLNKLLYSMGQAAFWLGLAGVVLLPARGKRLVIGWWLGYVVYGLTLPYQIETHNYYSLFLVPVIALSLAPLGAKLIEIFSSQKTFWKTLSLGILAAALIANFWTLRSRLRAQDYGPDVAAIQNLAAVLPNDRIIALTQDYGYRLKYYAWRQVDLWPTTGDFTLETVRTGQDPQQAYTADFLEKTKGYHYFLVTDRVEFDDQPNLEAILTRGYTSVQGDGYILFDLQNPKP
jgi:4-amino-4-deoxy-L-arabinose transferase-like glycosyltransferase